MGVSTAANTAGADKDYAVEAFNKDRSGTIEKASQNWDKIRSTAVEKL